MIRIIQKGEFMKKIKLFFCACFIFSLCFSLMSCQFVSEYEVHSFDMNEYQENLEIHRLREEFKDIEVCGKIKSGNDAVSKAKNVFDVVYGKFATGTQGPYDVYYDETREDPRFFCTSFLPAPFDGRLQVKYAQVGGR